MKKINKKFTGAIASGVIASTALVVAPAEAALNTGVSAGFTGLQTDALALIDLAWPVVIAVTVAFIIISLFKKAAGKAV